MKIPVPTNLPSKTRYHHDSLYAALAHLKPTSVLEIGTNYGLSASYITKYFDDHQPDGALVTCDIRKYVDITDSRVKQCVCFPHSHDSLRWHDVTHNQLLAGYNVNYLHSVEENVRIAQSALRQLGHFYFDVAFVDADHTWDSFLKDIDIAHRLTKYPHFILLDDMRDNNFDCQKAFEQHIMKKWEYYEFPEWTEAGFETGTTLIWKQ